MDSARWLEAGEPKVALQPGGRRGVMLLAGLALAAAWAHQPAAVFLLLAVIALASVARLWADRALEHVSCTFELPEDRAFPDDRLRLRLRAANQKLLPLACLRVRCAVPPALTPAGSARAWPYLDRGGYLQGASVVAWHSQVTWEFELECRARGVYGLGPLELAGADPFGLYVERILLRETAGVVVYPRIVALRRLGFPLAAGFGVSQRRRALEEDPSRAAGVRAYRPGDPLRRVHWKATARQRELQVRLLEPAAAPLLMLVLASDTFDFPWTRYREDLFELAVSALASIAWRALEDGWQVGCLANTCQPIRLQPASAPPQLREILEGLARATPGAEQPLTQLLRGSVGSLRQATYVVAAGRGTPRLRGLIEYLQVLRQPVVLLYGDDPPNARLRLPAYRLRQWDDLASTLEGPGEVFGGY